MVRIASKDKRDAKTGVSRTRSALKLIQNFETLGKSDSNEATTCPSEQLEAQSSPIASDNANPVAALVARVAALEEELAQKDRHLTQLNAMFSQRGHVQESSSPQAPPVGPWAWSRVGPLLTHGRLAEEHREVPSLRRSPSCSVPSSDMSSMATPAGASSSTSVVGGLQKPAARQRFSGKETPNPPPAPSPPPRRPQPRQSGTQPRQSGGQQGCRTTSPRRLTSPRQTDSRQPLERSPCAATQSCSSPRRGVSPRRISSSTTEGGGRIASVERPMASPKSSPLRVSRVVLRNSCTPRWPPEDPARRQKKEEVFKDVPTEDEELELPLTARAVPAPAAMFDDINNMSPHRACENSRPVMSPQPSTPMSKAASGRPACSPVKKSFGTPHSSCRSSPWRGHGPTSELRRPPPTLPSSCRARASNNLSTPVSAANHRATPATSSQKAHVASVAQDTPERGMLGVQRDYSGTWLSVEEQLKVNCSARSSGSSPPPIEDPIDYMSPPNQEPFGFGDDFLRIEQLVNDGA